MRSNNSILSNPWATFSFVPTQWHQWVGLVGALTILVTYLLLQLGRIKVQHLAYSVANALGALLLCISLLFEFNLSALLIEAFWVLVSLIGVCRYVVARRRSDLS